MSRFTQDSVERVKDATDIVEVISAYTELRRSGTRFTGLCPFHDERTPSFSVDPQEKLYHCFGCGVGGDVIRFVEEKEALAFADAVEALADRYGVEIEREQEDPRAEEQRQQAVAVERAARAYGGLLRELPARRPAGGEGPRVSRRPRAEGAGAGRLRRRLRAGHVGHGARARPARRLLGARDRGGGADPAKPEGQGALRPVPLADRVPDPRRAGAHAGVRGAGAAARSEAEVRQLARVGALPQAAHAVRDRPGAAGDRESGRAVVVEGYTDVLACHQAGIRTRSRSWERRSRPSR